MRLKICFFKAQSAVRLVCLRYAVALQRL